MGEETALFQQVNLYPEELRPKVDLLSASRMGAYVGGLFIILALMASWGRWELDRTEKEIERASLRQGNAELEWQTKNAELTSLIGQAEISALQKTRSLRAQDLLPTAVLAFATHPLSMACSHQTTTKGGLSRIW